MKGKKRQTANKAMARSFYILWIGQLFATIGHGLSSFGLGVYVFDLTKEATSISLVSLFAFLPSVVLAPLAGVLADRFDRRLLMMLGDGMSGLAMAIIYLLNLRGALQFWHILFCVFISSVFQALMDPSYRASVSDLVEEEAYAQASGLVQLAGSTKFLLAPALGGYLLSAIGLNGVLLVDSSTVLVTLLTTSLVRKRIGRSKAQEGAGDFWKDLKIGWQFLLRNKGVFYLMVLVSLVTFYMGFLLILFQPLVLSFTDAKTLGLATSIGAIGMVLSSLILGVKSLRMKNLRVLSLGLVLGGIFIMGLGLRENIYFITAMAFGFFMTLPFINAALEVLMRKAIPNAAQGRVWGLVSMVSQLGYILAYLMAGPLADNIFTPLLLEDGLLAASFLGHLLGLGPGRGIGLLFIISGLMILFIGLFMPRLKVLTELEED